jgi:hypothetical protein
MKRKSFLFVYLGLLVSLSWADDFLVVDALSLIDSVVVDTSPADLEMAKEGDAADLLWNNFATTPHVALFSHASCRNWYRNWFVFRDRLVEKAKGRGLGVAALKKCFREIAPDSTDEVAYLPISVHLAFKGSERVWIISRVWEYAAPYTEDSQTRYHALGHISVIAFSAKTLVKVGYVTCM